MKRKYLICILQHRQVNYAINAFLHLHGALRRNETLRKSCKIVIACSKHGSKELRKLQNVFGDDYDLDIFDCRPDYLDKLGSVFERYPKNEHQFFVKSDEDVSLSSGSWAQLLELSERELADEHTLLTTVNLSTGIPSWSRFVETFLTHEQKKSVHDWLITDKVPELMWGQNYERLNEFIRSLSKWDENAYWETVNSLPCFYKGVHPIRFRLYYALLVNRAILDRYSEFQQACPQSDFDRISDRYFCSSFFVIDYRRYQDILKDKSLFVDDFDEVPLNTYRAQHGMHISFLKGSLGVHIMYNSAYRENGVYNGRRLNAQEIELTLMRKYLDRVRSHLKDSGCQKVKRVALAPFIPFALRHLYGYMRSRGSRLVSR